jgi:hypothetical protein
VVNVSRKQMTFDVRFRNARRQSLIRHSVSAFATLCFVMAATAVPALASGGSSFVVHTNYLGPSNASRMVLARSDANRLLSLAWVPAGARRLSTWIHLNGFDLSQPAVSLGDPDNIDIARFYLAGPKNQGVSWLTARTPVGGTRDGYGGPDRAKLEWSYFFASTPILPQSELQYTKRILPDGDVEFRIDAQVAWAPQKSRFSIVPSGATMVQAVYTGRSSSNVVTKRLTASTTLVAMIATIRRQINALPVAYPGLNSCPYQNPGSITVRFFRTLLSRSFATVFFVSNSCGRVQIREFSSTHHPLGTGFDGGGVDAVPSVMKLLGLKSPL